MKAASLFFIIISCLTFYSCNKSIESLPESGERYFPLQPGKYIIYDVDSTDINDFNNQIYEFHFQVKEEVDSPYVSSNGDIHYRLIRSKRVNDSEPWREIDIWSVNVNNRGAEKVEENWRYVKMDFPLLTGRNWLGNAFTPDSSTTSLTHSVFDHDYQNWEYEYSRVYEDWSVNGFDFDSTILITHINDTTAHDTIVEMERYARDIGMVYKLFYHVDLLSTEDGNGVDSLEFPGGTIIEMRVKEFN